MNMTNAEKVLYNAHYKYAIETLKVSEEEAKKIASSKIESKRNLAKIINKH